jgi:hypothetical protein
MRAGVLAHGDGIPVPGRAFVIVARDDIERHAGRRREDRRQADDGRFGTEGLREIDNFERAGVERGDEIGEHGH